MRIHEGIKTYGLIVVIVIFSFWITSKFIAPPPPDSFVLAAGAPGGSYYQHALAYQKVLAAQDINVEIVETAGAVENIRLLREGKVDVAFIQSGLAHAGNMAEVETLGSLYYEPLWIFVRTLEDGSDLQSLAGKRLAIGVPGSGTNTLARHLLAANGINESNSTLLQIGGESALQSLRTGDIDALLTVSGFGTAFLQTMLEDESLYVLPFDRAESYTRQFPYLSRVTLTEGMANLADNRPAADVPLVSPVAMLVAHPDFHPALKGLLVTEVADIHRAGGAFASPGEFPTDKYADFPLAKEAARYYEFGPSFLQRYLPFWIADLVDRLKVLLIPLIGIMLPLMKIAPPTYQWRIRSRIRRVYKRLQGIEERIVSDSQHDRQDVMTALNRMDEDAEKIHVPTSYADELYNLRMHIRLVKQRLNERL